MSPLSSLRAAAAVVALALIAVPAAHASASYGPAMPAAEIRSMQSQGIREIIVKRDPGLSADQQSELRAQAGISYVGPGPLPDTELDQAPDGGLAAAVAALKRDPRVQYSEPNGELEATATPNDPYFGSQWGLANTGQAILSTRGTPGDDIGATSAWSSATGAGVTVAVVDTGADPTAPDLAGQLAGGASFLGGVVGAATPDQNGHGTHVSGIIAAQQGNGIGVSGVAPGARVMPLQALDASGQGSIDDVAAAFNYAGDHGVPIVNASLGGAGYSQTLADAVASHPGTLYVVAAGNGDANGNGYDVDSSQFYPCDLPSPNLICVGASDQNDQPASFSNFGATNVDLFAPGVNILSTWITSPGGAAQYYWASGTSMATPMVSATLALMLSRNPSLPPGQLRNDLLASVTAEPQLAGLAVTGGELDAAAAVTTAGGDAPAPSTSNNAPAPPAPAPVVHAPVRRAGLKLTHVALKRARHAQALVFTLSARARVQISLLRSSGRGRAADPLRISLTARKGTNRYALGALLRGRRLPRGRYALKVRAGSHTVTVRLNVS